MFCTVPVGICRVQAHQTSRTIPLKYNVEGSAFYILLINWKPLDKIFLSECYLVDILDQKLSLDHWTQLFIHLQSQVELCNQSEDDLFLAGTSGKQEMQIGVKNLRARVERAGDYPTPCKPAVSKRLSSWKTSRPVPLTRSVNWVTILLMKAPRCLSVVGADWNKMVGALEATVATVQSPLVDLF
jgi:hypothetical protein